MVKNMRIIYLTIKSFKILNIRNRKYQQEFFNSIKKMVSIQKINTKIARALLRIYRPSLRQIKFISFVKNLDKVTIKKTSLMQITL